MSSIPPPPQELFSVVGGAREVGKYQALALQEVAKLGRDERCLDVGCGVGRTAIPLTSYLSEDGGYEGFDVSAEAIQWCREEISSRFPNFGFTHTDLFNAAYNPSGSIQPVEFQFPYPSEHFDVAFQYSVFTHMLPEDLEHYLAEIHRVLKEGGRVLASFFLLNDETLDALAAAVASDPLLGKGAAKLLLESDHGDYNTGFDVAEWAVAYKEVFVRSLFAKHNLRIAEPILYGTWRNWSEESPFGGGQDLVLAYR